MRRYINGLRKRIAQRLYRNCVSIELESPIVSFTFDDVPHSGFAEGNTLLCEYGFAGTFYVSGIFLDHEGTVSYTADDVKAAFGNGHEIGCHTFGHLDSYRCVSSHLTEDSRKNQGVINQLLGKSYRLESFAYPYGFQTIDARKHAKSCFTSARSSENGINYGWTDLNNLRSVCLYERRQPLESIFRILGQAAEVNAWTVFYTHDIQEDSSPYGCSPGYFRKVVEYCATRELRVMTVRKAVQTILAT